MLLSRGHLQGEYSKQRWGGEVKECTWGLGRDAVINRREFWKRVFRDRMKVKNLHCQSGEGEAFLTSFEVRVLTSFEVKSPNLTSFAYLTAVQAESMLSLGFSFWMSKNYLSTSQPVFLHYQWLLFCWCLSGSNPLITWLHWICSVLFPDHPPRFWLTFPLVPRTVQRLSEKTLRDGRVSNNKIQKS